MRVVHLGRQVTGVQCRSLSQTNESLRQAGRANQKRRRGQLVAAEDIASVSVRHTVAASVGQEDEHEGCDYAPQGEAEDSIDVCERREVQRVEHCAVLEEQESRDRSKDQRAAAGGEQPRELAFRAALAPAPEDSVGVCDRGRRLGLGRRVLALGVWVWAFHMGLF
jgi:hypothetical protein